MRWFKIAIAVVVVAVALLLVFGVPVNFIVGTVKSRIEAQTGYRLRLGGETTLSFWPKPTISLRDITLSTGEENRFQAETIRAVLTLRDLWHGHAHVTELTVLHPTLRLPLPRHRLAPEPASAPAAAASDNANSDQPEIDRIVVKDGTVVFYGRSDHDEGQLERVNLDVSHAPADTGFGATGSFYVGAQVVDIDLKSQAMPQRFEEQAIPVRVTLQAPGLSTQPLALSAELRARGNALAINTLSGRMGDNAFDGFASVDFGASKPMVKADIAFNRLQILPADGGGSSGSGASRPTALIEPWSTRRYDFDALNFFDAQMNLSSTDLGIGSFHLTPVALQTTLSGGVLQGKFANTPLYGGTVDATVVLDASGTAPKEGLSAHLTGVSALPLLTAIADFDSLEGSMQATVDVHATGDNQQAAFSSLNGAVDAHLSNGDVRGIDLAKIMHDLTNTILNGWQWNANDKTPLTDLTAHFTIANGVATTDNLTLTGPVVQMTGAGKIDIGAKTLDVKVDPKLMVGQQNGSTSPSAGSSNAAANGGSGQSSGQGTGLGVPVQIQGSWAAPRIFPDVAGILNNPGAIFNQLQNSGLGLFGQGKNGGNGDANGNDKGFDSLIGGIGHMLNGSGGNGSSGNGSGGNNGGGFFGNNR